MILIDEAIYKLYPNAVTCIGGEKAFDKDGNEITLDFNLINPEFARIQAEYDAKEQAAIDTKASALAKLAALGLTQDEVKAILGAA
jgi:hypothetical protein